MSSLFSALTTAEYATIKVMGFLQSFAVALVLAVTSLISGTLGFLHVAQTPTAEVPSATSSTTTTASNNPAPAIASPTSTTTTAVASSGSPSFTSPLKTSTTSLMAKIPPQQSTQAYVIDPETGFKVLASQWAECQSAAPLIDQEGNVSAARKDAQHVFNGECGILAGATPSTFVALDYYYGKDATGIWLLANPSEDGGEPISWQIIGADPSSFALLPDPENEPNPTFDITGPSFEGFSWTYTKDKKHVYNLGQLVPQADPTTFVVVDPPESNQYNIDAHDNTFTYFDGKVVGSYPPAAVQ
jgi:hypothetical protein